MLTSPCCTACAFALCRPNHDEAKRKNNATVVPTTGRFINADSAVITATVQARQYNSTYTADDDS